MWECAASPPPAAGSPHRYAGSKPYTRSKQENQVEEQYPITSPVLQVVKLGQVRAAGADVGVELVSRKCCMKTLGCGVLEAQRREAQQDTPVPWNQAWGVCGGKRRAFCRAVVQQGESYSLATVVICLHGAFSPVKGRVGDSVFNSVRVLLSTALWYRTV